MGCPQILCLLVVNLIALIGFTEFVNLLQCFGLLVLQSLNARVEMDYLFLRILSQILVLLDGHLFVDLENIWVVKSEIDISEGEDCFHSHEKRNPGFDREYAI